MVLDFLCPQYTSRALGAREALPHFDPSIELPGDPRSDFSRAILAFYPNHPQPRRRFPVEVVNSLASLGAWTNNDRLRFGTQRFDQLEF